MTFYDLKAMSDDELRDHIRAIVSGHEPSTRRDNRDGHDYDRAWFVANERGLRDFFLECLDARNAERKAMRRRNYETFLELNARQAKRAAVKTPDVAGSEPGEARGRTEGRQ